MKILIISDVHSNYKALKAVVENEKSFDAVLFAGDMVEFGMEPREVVSWMQKNKVIAVAGNHDIGLSNAYKDGFIPLENPLMATTFLEHNLSLLTKKDMEYISSLPLEVKAEFDGITYFMTHIYDENDGQALLHHLESYHSISKFEEFWAKKVGETKGKRCLILGDTHHCMMVQLKEDALIVNPGSVGYNLGSDGVVKGASYIVIEDGIPYFRYANYDTTDEYDIVKNQMPNLDDWQKATGLLIFGTGK
ncbi:MAG: metallophosphoesterase family protein [Clostridia bacterium]|nr:metallophosphoesterase family protein [Clostridia bacterium]